MPLRVMDEYERLKREIERNHDMSVEDLKTYIQSENINLSLARNEKRSLAELFLSMVEQKKEDFADYFLSKITCMEGLWKCEDTKYRKKIVERLATLTDEEMNIVNSKENMPPIYEAIFRGEKEWVLQFEEVMFEDPANPKRYQTVKWKTKIYSFSIMLGSSTQSLYFEDPLTAAIWSNNIGMVEYISKTVELPRQLRGIKQAIAGSNYFITCYMIAHHPEYVDQIEPSCIIDGKNQYLMQYYLNKHPQDLNECIERFRLSRQNNFPRISRLKESEIKVGVKFYDTFLEWASEHSNTPVEMVNKLRQDIYKELMKRNEEIELDGKTVNRNQMEYIPEIDEKLELFRIYRYWGGEYSEELAEYLYEEYVRKYNRKEVYWKEKWQNRKQIETRKMQLKELEGKHLLYGVEYRPSIRGVEEDDYAYANDVLICLDGITYVLTEDEEDSYGSYMSKMQITDMPLKNTFPPQLVDCEYDAGIPEYEDNDILNIYSEDEKLILQVGTENYTDPHPRAIFEFNPENLLIDLEYESDNIFEIEE